MTEAQEIILDRLMVEEMIEAKGESTPLGLAFQALDGCLSGRREFTRTLGFPPILRQALHAANATLERTDDRRELAITVFSVVAPRRKSPALGRQRQIEVALWGALRVHPLVCRAACPHAASIEKSVKHALATRRASSLKLPSGPVCCPAAVTRDSFDAALYGSSPEQAASAALAYVVGFGWMSSRHWHVDNCRWAGGFAARVATMVRGAAGASDFCLALAREVGL